MKEKPLHIQVAEALGRVSCKEWRLIACGMAGPVYGKVCNHEDCYPASMPPLYDTNWSATGPLIERYGIELEHFASTWCALGPEARRAGGRTPLLAVCNLILALKKAGKLA